jgi:hypothetical protein
MAMDRQGDDAPLRPVGGVDEIQVVGALSDTVIEALGITTDARSVWLHPDAVTHIITRRASEAEFILQNIPVAILRPAYVGVEMSDQRRICVVHKVGQPHAWLHVAIKLVTAAEARSSKDELWISTAHPLGRRSLTRMRNKVTLWNVENLEQG